MTPARTLAAIDQGTTSTRCMLFDSDGRVLALAQREHRQIFPRPGWVEHDAEEIWQNTTQVVEEALRAASLGPADVVALGITNQRETVLVWDRATGEPLCPAIVWQDARTADVVQELADTHGGPDAFRAVCGLPLATYFSGPKLAWLFANVPDLFERAEQGDALIGTIDTWLIWRLTGGRIHATDVTNASRTMLMDLETLDWDPGLLEAFGVPKAALPQIRPSATVFGHCSTVLPGVPIAAALGDQQAALFGQGCTAEGQIKATFGTGAFLLMNTGTTPMRSGHGLLTTVGYQIGDDAPRYALEGSVAVAGAAIQWLRDNLGIVDDASQIEGLAGSVPDTGGAVFVPAFAGLFAPHWRADARGVMAGLTAYVTKAHIARATLEATAWQTRDVIEVMRADTGLALATVQADGGMAANYLFLQMLSDALGVQTSRPALVETTCFGAARAAGIAVGLWDEGSAPLPPPGGQWHPTIDADDRERRYRRWHKAVQRSLGWLDDDMEGN